MYSTLKIISKIIASHKLSYLAMKRTISPGQKEEFPLTFKCGKHFQLLMVVRLLYPKIMKATCRG